MFNKIFNFFERRRLLKHHKKLDRNYAHRTPHEDGSTTYHFSNVDCINNRARFYCTPVQCAHVTAKGEVIDGGSHLPEQGLCPYIDKDRSRHQMVYFERDRGAIIKYLTERAKVVDDLSAALKQMDNFIDRYSNAGENKIRT